MTTLSEERVLRPLDPVPQDVNEWPDFALQNVKIFYQGKSRYADLLEATTSVPLCVVGELMPLDDDQEHLTLVENSAYIRLKIENVINYSFGQNDEGKPVVWAAGKAGWYEIDPSDRYLSHYANTVEAIDLFYFMVDQMQRLSPKRKRLGFQVDPFLRGYQKHTDYKVDDDDEAMEILHKHHSFLLKQMIEERENIDWSQTHLWNHLAETYAEEIDRMRTTLALDRAVKIKEVSSSASASSSSPSSSSSSSSTSEQGDEEEVGVGESSHDEVEVNGDDRMSEDDSSSSSSESESQSTETAVSKSHSETTSEDEDDSRDWTRPIWTLLNILRKSPTFDIKNAGMDAVATEIQKIPDFTGKHKTARAALERSAEALLRLMHEAKLRKKFNWSTRAIYAELEATLANEIAEDVVKTPAPKTANKKHRLKSVLRPSGSGKASKSTLSHAGDEDDDEDEMMQEDDAMDDVTRLSRSHEKQRLPTSRSNRARGGTPDTLGSRMDSPSRQLNGHINGSLDLVDDANALPELPPLPEAQEMIDLVKVEAKKTGRLNQTSHLEAFLGQLGDW